MKEAIRCAEGLLLDNEGHIQKVRVPEYTIFQIREAGGLTNMPGASVDLVPPTPKAKLIGIYDILVPYAPSDVNKN